MLYRHSPDGSWELAPQTQQFIDKTQATWERNRQIYAAVKAGKPRKEIAKELGISLQRVGSILQRVESETVQNELPPIKRYKLKEAEPPKPRCPHCGQVISKRKP